MAEVRRERYPGTAVAPTELQRTLQAMDRPPVARVATAFGALVVLTAIGTLGFAWIEDLSLLDALYMTVITLSTVGYQEVAPATPESRAFTIAFIVVGVGVTFYTVVSLAEFVLEGRLRGVMGRRSMERAIEALRGHVIVCGFGRLGRTVVEELERERLPLVVVESDPALEAEVAAGGRLYRIGSALEDSVLHDVGIERARAIVIATSSDADNVFIALSARELAPAIAVHARAETSVGLRRLRLAGAQQVISVHSLAGQRMAQAIARPAVVDFLELASAGGGAPIDLEEVHVSAGSALIDQPIQTIADRRIRVTAVAVKRAGGVTELHPAPTDVLREGDHLVVVGDRENLARLAALAQASAGS